MMADDMCSIKPSYIKCTRFKHNFDTLKSETYKKVEEMKF
jgi:hypothetical protein